ncbi:MULTISPECIES: ImmA/IrrE family metallo-endopeptidase [Rothia]|jgi:hypothetical protein|uniref:ImmA/IrrE family metallo-endopeptidase n=1 Tax=Rothia TaxID=32207 RepID=UPI0008A38482|nr:MULTISPECIES: ImmA/IrrE family metallo-endopeptidase [Rothia]OFO76650.1 hypothetical protein HMPREF3016_08840 [Rothia sp. HMSC065D02]
MSVKVPVEPSVLRWALDRADMSEAEKAFDQLHVSEWLSQDSQPTISQLTQFAQKTHVPFGMLFLSEPPADEKPIADFRFRGFAPEKYSAELTETIMKQQRRQSWYRDYAIARGLTANEYVGSETLVSKPEQVADRIRHEFGYTPGMARSGAEARKEIIELLEENGFLVSVAGVVGSNTRRPYDPNEFSGFSLSDDYAPTIFVNGRDTKNAQIFTLLHELGHLLLGESGVSASDGCEELHQQRVTQQAQNERWCDSFAAHFLVPPAELHKKVQALHGDEDEVAEEFVKKLAHHFCVSTLTILNSLLNEKLITWNKYTELYGPMREQAIMGARSNRQKTKGGNYHTTRLYALGKRFASAVFADAASGRTTYTEAQRLLGIPKTETYKNLAQKIGGM